MAAKYLTLTDASFKQEVLESDVPVLVDFWAPWCGPCRALAPVIDKLAEEFDGRVKIGKLSVDDNQQVPMQYSVRSIPTLLFFKGGKVVEQRVGVVSKGEIASTLIALAVQES